MTTISLLSKLKEGMIYSVSNRAFETTNNARFICGDTTSLNRKIAYFQFSDRGHQPIDKTILRKYFDEEIVSVSGLFALWQHDLDHQSVIISSAARAKKKRTDNPLRYSVEKMLLSFNADDLLSELYKIVSNYKDPRELYKLNKEAANNLYYHSKFLPIKIETEKQRQELFDALHKIFPSVNEFHAAIERYQLF